MHAKGVVRYVSLAAAGILLIGCGIPKEKYDRQVAVAKELHKQLKACKGDKEALSAKVARLEGDLAKVREVVAAQKKEIARGKQAAAELERLRREAAEQKALNERLMGQFRDMISAGQLRIVNVNGRLVIKMASRILFKPGRADLTKAGERALEKLGKVLSRVPRHFQVAGHTDNRPTKRSKYKDNWELAAMRAVRVVRILRKAGVPGKNVSAAAFAEFQPAATNRTAIGRRLNRRIEITLLPVIPSRVK